MISAWLFTLLRSLLIGIIATFFVQKLFKQQNCLYGKRKTLFLTIALLPLIVPPLLPAYAYSAFSINFQTQTLYNELLYIALMTFRVIPLGLILMMLAPASVSSSSSHCDALLPQRNFSFIFRESRFLAVLCLCSLFVFHDYETASLLRITHWTVVLFNAHAGGLVMNLPGSLNLALFPAMTSLVFIFSAWKLLSNCKAPQEYLAHKNNSSWVIIFLSILTLLIIPIYTVSTNSISGFKDVFLGGWMLNETVNSLALTIVSLICCLGFSWWIILNGKKSILFSVIPGLFGPLILGLFFIYLFNLPILNSTKHSILPLTLATVIYGLPLSILLCIALKKLKSQNDATIKLLGNRNQSILKWSLLHRPALLTTLPLFCFLWFDLTLSSMLAPASITTLFPRLYNLMHYSENEKLSATVIVVTVLPLALYMLLYFILKMRVQLTSKT
ncbi:MAG: hypothetical protein NE328_04430 [Lentisphaeraceae bacterium]|nr:hypothetical protein [Lentisphaeraceae bacterium]